MASKSKAIQSGTITVESGGGYSTLQCPYCGGDNLHHLGVEVFDRGEDELTLTHTRVISGMVASHRVGSEDSGNPSSRRDGMIISFDCEGCSCDPIQLLIAQHKGFTLLEWHYVTHPERDEEAF